MTKLISAIGLVLFLSVATEIYSAINEDSMKVVCYFSNIAYKRRGIGKYKPEYIPKDLCTHVIYSNAILDESTLTIKSSDPKMDIDEGLYEGVTSLKKEGVRVLISIGGWDDSVGDKYSRMVRSSDSRARFVASVVEFMEKHKFDGLDFDWQYPVCWRADCSAGYLDEKEHLVELMRELSEAFQPHNWLLSVTALPKKNMIDKGYDVPNLSKYVDWINVMAYNYHNHWSSVTGNNAPLYGSTPYDVNNANYSISYWIEKGAPQSKIVMGLQILGSSFTLKNVTSFDIGAPAINNGGKAGEYTEWDGWLSYYEICINTNFNGWSVVHDSDQKAVLFAFSGDQWVSFDDVETTRQKAIYVRQMNLGGVSFSSLDTDDFRGICDHGKYPLLKTLNEELLETAKHSLPFNSTCSCSHA